MEEPVLKNLYPQQMVSQWRILPHKFQLNLWNFDVQAGRAAQKIFQGSFSKKKFNDSGSIKWAPRSAKSRYKHPLMVETGSLKNSIKWKLIGQNGATVSFFGQSKGVEIFTDPNGFGNAKRHKGFCYAAVHNAPFSAGTRTGHMASMPRRHFMGHSDLLTKKLKELSKVIFKGFPK